MSEKLNCDDFLRGQRDCQKGEYKQGQSEDYNKGYAAQYAFEQEKDALYGYN